MTDNIFNKTIEGDISRRSINRTAQAEPELLVDALNTLLDRPEVEAVRWSQSTPYFNDGDVCEFGIYDIRVRFVGDDEEAGDYEDGFREAWGLTYQRSGGEFPYKPEGLEVTDELIEAIDNANKAVAGGAHYHTLEDLFGDPSEVTATQDGFNIEYYDHD